MAVISYICNITVKKISLQHISKIYTPRNSTFNSWSKLEKQHPPAFCRKFYLATHTKSKYTPNFYDVLGVPLTADLQTIKLAYFNLAKKFHPDTNKGEEAKFMFQSLAEAYDVLSDERKRANYDEFGSVGHTYGGKSNGPERPSGSASQSYDSEELFLKIFGEADGREANSAYQAEKEFNDQCDDGFDSTREYVMPISFVDATRGCVKPVNLKLRVICIKCEGTKSDWGFQSNVCPYCEGTGVETEKLGHILTTKTCSYCDGTKLFNRFKCTECAGTGQMIMAIPEYEIKIPPGSVDGQYLNVPIDNKYLKYTGPEHQTHFYVKLVVEKSKYFKREGNDVYTQNDISVSQALLGGTLSVEGLHSNEIRITLPSNPTIETSHKTLVAPGEGIFMSEELGHGNHFVEVGIRVPTVLSEKQKALLLKVFESETELQNGIVENDVECDFSHKYKANVINPSKCEREFNISNNV